MQPMLRGRVEPMQGGQAEHMSAAGETSARSWEEPMPVCWRVTERVKIRRYSYSPLVVYDISALMVLRMM